MIREAELEEMEKKWREENERIMREHPQIEPPTIEPAPPVESADEPRLPLGDKNGLP
jgi:sec-independent protein translocase protein TatB